MWDRPDARADAHWAAVSQATQMAAHWRAERRRQRRRGWRRRVGLHLVHVGLRLAVSISVPDMVEDRAKARPADG